MPSAGSANGASASRIVSLDILRGLIMVVMAIDHSRDFFTNLRFEPETLSQTYYALFFTRWITHFCAPLFFFLAGTGAYFYGRRRTPQALSRFLWTRGLWLIVLEFTVVGAAWSFQVPFGFLGVIWALGASMIIMAAVVRLPMPWIIGLSTGMIVTHNLLDRVRPEQFGSLAWLWTILHVRGDVLLPFHIPEFVLFPLVPLVAVMAAGYAFGTLYFMEADRRRKWLLRLGLGLTLAFIFLRVTNLYGNPPVGLGGVSQGDWSLQPSLEKTIILFLDVEKYPPSLQFLLMTLGPAFLLLAWLDQKNGKPHGPLTAALLTFGRVPMFFYILHLYLIHWLAVLVAALSHQPVSWLFHGAIFGETPDGYGHGLPVVYLMWLTAVVILYFPCRWFAALKQRRKDWWLSYV
ncbi:MAG: heparan-alpha-glucosaminide N-acetyltransferase domain-containing protein [Acidobacteriia bacterium]|nr:heparan-alpha-glucosaminide N-acetyltransferase domain-containing protein [Terriglobia bacterium]